MKIEILEDKLSPLATARCLRIVILLKMKKIVIVETVLL
jgi:hypothetical protein